LRRFQSKRSGDPNLLLGLDARDDAAVYRLSGGLLLVQTVDFFTPVVDDPYEWGAIAVANAVSDIYAMGGRPLTGLNLAAWPKDLDFGLLARVLEGGADKAEEAGLQIVGGHTIDDAEPKYGMAVTGIVEQDAITPLSAAQPGMDLVLTKPLGTGVMSTALKQQMVPGDVVKEATKLMMTLNADAAWAASLARVPAATDVTGFGLLGHLHNMCVASGVGAEISADAVPMISGVRELAEAGFVSGGTKRNEAHFLQFVTFSSDVSDVERSLLFDAQTSGGLLLAVPPAATKGLLDNLIDRGVPCAAVIGKVVEGASAIQVESG